MEYMEYPYEPAPEQETLQLLTLAQKTAEEHIARARRDADKICADGQGKAEQIIRDAEAHASVLQEHAEKTLSDAHATAAEIAREAQANANNARRNAEEVLADARARADEITKTAQQSADDLMHQAQLRYEERVGGLATKREALQRQIDALKQFDQDYRTRLTAVIQGQLRALWVDEPRVTIDDAAMPPAAGSAPPAKREGASGADPV